MERTLCGLFFVSVICLFIGYTVQPVFGQAVDKGIIGQVIGNDETQFYVHGVTISEDSGSKVVNVSMVFKNKNLGQQEFDPSDVRLVDSESRESSSEYSSDFPSIYIPSGDTLTWNAQFKILPSNNVSKVYLVPHGSQSRLTVDLTKSMNPPNDPPKSSWIVSPIKGVKLNNNEMEITINDEKYIGNTYVVDLTIKNIGSSPIHYSASDFKVKDAEGFAYPYSFLYNILSPLLSGDLPPSEMVRGDVAFNVKKSTGNMMLILSGLFGNPFLNTGTLPPQVVEKTSGTKSIGNSVEIALGSSNPNNGKAFVPKALQVSKGATVVWTNKDETLHTVTSGSAASGNSGIEFDSSYLATGKQFQHMFKDARTFDYYCTLHPYMNGQVIVK